jgi:hypothetical protein
MSLHVRAILRGTKEPGAVQQPAGQVAGEAADGGADALLLTKPRLIVLLPLIRRPLRRYGSLSVPGGEKCRPHLTGCP